MEEKIKKYFEQYRICLLLENLAKIFLQGLGALLVFFLLSAFIDYLFPLGKTGRYISALMLWAILAFISYECYRRLTQYLSFHHCILHFEKRRGVESNVFINSYIFMFEHDYSLNVLKQLVVKEASTVTEKLPVLTRTEMWNLWKQALKITSILIVFAVLFFGMERFRTSFWRMVKPWSSMVSFSNYKLEGDFKNHRIFQGEDITLNFCALTRPSERSRQKLLIFNYRIKDSDAWERMAVSGDRDGNYTVIKKYNVKSFDWYCEYGDFKSPPYKVEIASTPKIEEFNLELQSPFLSFPTKKISQFDSVVEFITGSRVKLAFKSESEIIGVSLVNTVLEKTIPLEKRNTLWVGDWEQIENGSFDLKFEYSNHQTLHWQNALIFKKALNNPPKIEFDESSQFEFNDNSKRLDLQFEATDDWGMQSIHIFNLDSNDKTGQLLSEHEFNPPKNKFNGLHHISLKNLNRMDDQIVLKIVVTDAFMPESKHHVVEEIVTFKREKVYRQYKLPTIEFKKRCQNVFKCLLNYLDDPMSDVTIGQFMEALLNIQEWLLNSAFAIKLKEMDTQSFLKQISFSLEWIESLSEINKEVLFSKIQSNFKPLCSEIFKAEIHMINIFFEGFFQEFERHKNINILTDYKIYLQEFDDFSWGKGYIEKLQKQQSIVSTIEKGMDKINDPVAFNQILSQAKLLYEQNLQDTSRKDFSAFLASKMAMLHKRITLLHFQAQSIDIEMIRRKETTSWPVLRAFWEQVLNDSILQMKYLGESTDQSNRLPGEIDLYTATHQINEFDIWVREGNEYKALSKLKRIKELLRSFLNKTSSIPAISLTESHDHTIKTDSSESSGIHLILPNNGDCYFPDTLLSLKFNLSDDLVQKSMALKYRDDDGEFRTMWLDPVYDSSQTYTCQIATQKLDIQFRKPLEIYLSTGENSEIASEQIVLYPFKLDNAVDLNALMYLHGKFPLIWERYTQNLKPLIEVIQKLEEFIVKEIMVTSDMIDNFHVARHKLLAIMFELEQAYQDLGWIQGKEDDPLIRFYLGIWKDWKFSFERVWELFAMVEESLKEGKSSLEMMLNISQETQKWQLWLNEVAILLMDKSRPAVNDNSGHHALIEQMRNSLADFEGEIKRNIGDKTFSAEKMIYRFESLVEKFSPHLNGIADTLKNLSESELDNDPEYGLSVAVSCIKNAYDRLKNIAFEDLRESSGGALNYQQIYRRMSEISQDSKFSREVLMDPGAMTHLALLNASGDITSKDDLMVIPDEGSLSFDDFMSLNHKKLDALEDKIDSLKSISDPVRKAEQLRHFRQLFVVMRLHMESLFAGRRNQSSAEGQELLQLKLRLEKIDQKVKEEDQQSTQFMVALSEAESSRLQEKADNFYRQLLTENVTDSRKAFIHWQASIQKYNETVAGLMTLMIPDIKSTQDASNNITALSHSLLMEKDFWVILHQYTDKEVFSKVLLPFMGLNSDDQAVEVLKYRYHSLLVNSQSIITDLAPRIQNWLYQFYSGVLNSEDWEKYSSQYIDLQNQLEQFNRQLSELSHKGIAEGEQVEQIMIQKQETEAKLEELALMKLNFFNKQEFSLTLGITQKRPEVLTTKFNEVKTSGEHELDKSEVEMSDWILSNLEDELKEIDSRVNETNEGEGKFLLFKEIAGLKDKDIKEVKQWLAEKTEKEHVVKSGQSLNELIGMMENAVTASENQEQLLEKSGEKTTQFSKIRYLDHFRSQKQSFAQLKDQLINSHLATEKLNVDLDQYFDSIDRFFQSESIDLNQVEDLLKLEKQALKTMAKPTVLAVHLFASRDDRGNLWSVIDSGNSQNSFSNILNTWIRFYELSVAGEHS